MQWMVFGMAHKAHIVNKRPEDWSDETYDVCECMQNKFA